MAQKDIDVQANGTHASAPSPAEGFEVLLITGMSGAGRSHAADSIEDMGWYVVDNMPPKLLVPLVDMMTTGSNIHKLAAVVDVRSRDYFDDLSRHLIWEIYKKDFQLFRYDFDNPDNKLPKGEVDLDEVHAKLGR